MKGATRTREQRNKDIFILWMRNILCGRLQPIFYSPFFADKSIMENLAHSFARYIYPCFWPQKKKNRVKREEKESLAFLKERQQTRRNSSSSFSRFKVSKASPLFSILRNLTTFLVLFFSTLSRVD